MQCDGTYDCVDGIDEFDCGTIITNVDVVQLSIVEVIGGQLNNNKLFDFEVYTLNEQSLCEYCIAGMYVFGSDF